MKTSTLIAMMAVLAVTTPERIFADAGKETTVSPAAERNEFVRADGKTTLLLFTGSDWCIWCKKLEKEVFSTPEFKKGIEGKYELVVCDFPRDKSKIDPATTKRNQALKKKFSPRGFPTVFAIAPTGETICSLGYHEGGPEAWLKYAKNEIAIADVVATYLKPFNDEFDKLDNEIFPLFQKVEAKKLEKSALDAPLAKLREFVKRLESAKMPESLAARKKDLLDYAKHVVKALEEAGK